MADALSFKKPQLPSKDPQPSTVRPKPSAAIGKTKSFSNHFLCKFLLFVIFLVAIPLFPSQAPDFVRQAILIKFWEPVRLLFIGIAVSCGCSLFCGHNVDSESVQVSNFDDSHSSFVSRIFHVCPIFEDGYANLSGVDDKAAYKPWNSNSGFQKGENFDNSTFANRELEKSESSSLDYHGEFENPLSKNEMWNSQYLQAEPMVVMSEASRKTDVGHEFASVVDYKPLGLPVRSLTSAANGAIHQVSDGIGGEISSRVTDSSFDSSKKIRHGKDVVNSVQKSVEISNEPEPSWFSMAGGEFTVEDRNGGDVPVQAFGLPADEPQSKSQSFRLTTSQTSSFSHSPPRHSSSSSYSYEANSEGEEHDKTKSSRASYPPLKSVNGATRLNAFHLRRYSSGSLFKKDHPKSNKGEGKDSRSRNRVVEEPLTFDGEVNAPEEGKRDKKHDKASSVGKSVRSVRASKLAAVDALKVVADETEAIDWLNESSKRKLDNEQHFINEIQKDQREFWDFAMRKDELQSPENIAMVAAAAAPSTDSTGYDSGEVDRKAGEFIAKFKEQIRLQKEASIDRARGRRISTNHFR